MDQPLSYQRSKFATRLPRDRRYTASHFWMREEGPSRWQVGFTRFATRMLGEIVEFEFEADPSASVAVGQVVGWIEGFKAVAELYTPMAGVFLGGNPELNDEIEEVHKKPYDAGWLYTIEGEPPADALDAEGYAAFLDETIDRMMGREG